ncbi:MAG: cytochrome d ubiquinol oxidase subunit II [Myxococcota bacterium]
MTTDVLAAGLLAAVLVAYVLTGVADYGGGLWDLLATGPTAPRQRRAIADAIGATWEANHVWLVAAVVITFVCFPLAFAAIGTALHLPLVALLVGVVLRGTAFVFRAYDTQRDVVHHRWSVLFAASSVGSPVMLGIVVGAIASGSIHLVDGVPDRGFVWTWLAPFPVVVGGLTLAIAAFLAAVYLTLDTRGDPELQEQFRVRGLGAAGAVFVLAWAAFFLARTGAPVVWDGLWSAWWAIPFQLVVGATGLGCIGALWTRRYSWARDLAAAQTVLVIGGWAAAQWPYVVPPDLTVAHAAPPAVTRMLVATFAAGGVPLLAAYAWLLRTFGKA